MENATEALKMAGAVLMFIIALSVSINAFGHARETADTVMANLDRETTYIDGDMYYRASEDESIRKVGIESVIPTLKRVFNEGYEVEFIFHTENKEPIFTVLATSSTDETDDEQVIRVGKENNYLEDSPEGKNIFLKAILYGTDANDEDWKEYYGDKIKLPSKSLYERLKSGVAIIEKAGEYRIEKESDANEEVKRVIKYEVNEIA